MWINYRMGKIQWIKLGTADDDDDDTDDDHGDTDDEKNINV